MKLDEVGPVLKPGAERELKLKIKEFTQISEKLYELKGKSDKLATMFGKDDSFKKELSALKTAVNAKIKSLESELTTKQEFGNKQFIDFWNKNVETNASESLAVFRKVKKVLYRGSMSYDKLAFVGRSRSDRLPMDSNMDAQKLFNMALVKMGIEATRGNSIFTTTDHNQAENYGTLYVIIPINGFKYSYTKIKDVTIDDVEWVVSPNKFKQLDKQLRAVGSSSYDYDLKYTDDLEYELKKINRDFKKDPVLSKVKLEDLVSVDQVKKKYNPQNTKIEIPLKAGYELLINGTYYAFEYEKFNQLISHVMGFKI